MECLCGGAGLRLKTCPVDIVKSLWKYMNPQMSLAVPATKSCLLWEANQSSNQNDWTPPSWTREALGIKTSRADIGWMCVRGLLMCVCLCVYVCVFCWCVWVSVYTWTSVCVCVCFLFIHEYVYFQYECVCICMFCLSLGVCTHTNKHAHTQIKVPDCAYARTHTKTSN